MNLKAKKVFSVLFIALLVVTIIAISSFSIFGGDLGCDDVSECTGKASCGESGEHQGCEITCEGGPTISCPPVSQG